DRARVEADRAVREQVASAHRDEVGCSRPRAYEVHRHHDSRVRTSAQVAGPTATRAATSQAPVPPAARAAASATDGTPINAKTLSDRVSVRTLAASSSFCGTRTSGTFNADAAAAMPGSRSLAAGAARSASAFAIKPARSSAV